MTDITFEKLLQEVEITTWDDAFRTFALLPSDQRIEVSFTIDRGDHGVRRHRVSVPCGTLKNDKLRPSIGRYLASTLYNRLVTEGGKSVTVESNRPGQEDVIAELICEELCTRMRRMQFYCNFGDPVPVRTGGSMRIPTLRPSPSALFPFQPSRGCALGIDIGGTRIKLAMVENGECISQYVTEVDNRSGGQALAHQVEALVTAHMGRLAQLFRRKPVLDGIGVGVAGVLKGQRIVRMTNFERHWAAARRLSVAQDELGPDLFPDDYAALNRIPQYLRLRFGVENVALINDADAFGFQEVVSQPEAHTGTVVVMTLGTGVGYVKVTDGVIENLPHQGGHIIVGLRPSGDDFDALPIDLGCGHHGCLAAYVSATALTQQLQRVVGGSMVSVGLIDQILETVKAMSSWLAIAVAELAEILPDLDEVVLGAGVVCGGTGDLILRFTTQALHSRFPNVSRKVRVTLSKTAAEWGGAMGAAQYANSLAQSRGGPKEPTESDLWKARPIFPSKKHAA